MKTQFNIAYKYCPDRAFGQKCPTPDHCDTDCHFNTADVETRKVKPYPYTPEDNFERNDVEYDVTRRYLTVAVRLFLGVVVISIFMFVGIVIGRVI